MSKFYIVKDENGRACAVFDELHKDEANKWKKYRSTHVIEEANENHTIFMVNDPDFFIVEATALCVGIGLNSSVDDADKIVVLHRKETVYFPKWSLRSIEGVKDAYRNDCVCRNNYFKCIAVTDNAVEESLEFMKKFYQDFIDKDRADIFNEFDPALTRILQYEAKQRENGLVVNGPHRTAPRPKLSNTGELLMDSLDEIETGLDNGCEGLTVTTLKKNI